MSQAQPISHTHPDNLAMIQPGRTLEKIVSLLHQDQAIILVLGTSRDDLFTLLDGVQDALKQSNFILRINQPAEGHSLYHQLAAQLNFSGTASAHPQFSALVEHAISAANDRRIVLLCADVDRFDSSSLEQLRQLSNHNPAGHKAISLVLFGSRTLLKQLGSQRLRALQQRITAQFELGTSSTFPQILKKKMGYLSWGLATLLLSAYLWTMFAGQYKTHDQIEMPLPLPSSLNNAKNTAAPPNLSAAPPLSPPQDSAPPEALELVFKTEQEALQTLKVARP